MNLASEPIESRLVGVRVVRHPKAKPHPGHPTDGPAGSTISGFGAKRPLPEADRREPVDPVELRAAVQKKECEEWMAVAGHPDEPEADSIVPGTAPQGRTPEQEHVAGMQEVDGAVDYPDDALGWKIPQEHEHQQEDEQHE